MRIEPKWCEPDLLWAQTHSHTQTLRQGSTDWRPARSHFTCTWKRARCVLLTSRQMTATHMSANAHDQAGAIGSVHETTGKAGLIRSIWTWVQRGAPTQTHQHAHTHTHTHTQTYEDARPTIRLCYKRQDRPFTGQVSPNRNTTRLTTRDSSNIAAR